MHATAMFKVQSNSGMLNSLKKHIPFRGVSVGKSSFLIKKSLG